MRAQNNIICDVERVLGIPRGMACRNVERLEVVVGVFDFRAVFDGVAHRDEDVFDLLARDRQRMAVADPSPVSRQGYVEAFALECRSGFRLRRVLCWSASSALFDLRL